jgi:F-type H+-transporting ATPase subunit b
MITAVVTQSPNPILPSTGEIVWSVISFVILLVVLVKVAFPPVARMMAQRSERIRSDLEAADAARREAEALRAQREQELASAREDARRILDEARRTAEALREEILQRAREEAAAVRAQVESQLAAERTQVVRALRQEVGDLAVELAAKIIQSELERSTTDPLVAAFLREVEPSD